MRILLVTYEFPPGHSPRALRWCYLVRELVLLGHEVHVLVPDMGDPGVTFPAAPGAVRFHRTFAGPLATLVRRLTGKGRRRHANRARGIEATVGTTGGLNWKGRLVEWLKACVGAVLFPDARAEWSPWATAALKRLLVSVPPDVVVTSHEPASTLSLGRRAHRLGFRWVADLGDPVCAPYTPRRWRARARALEVAVAAEADLVLVPNERARDLLAARHGLPPDRCMVLSQGYDDRRLPTSPAMQRTPVVPDQLELLYTGRLYPFRNPGHLIQVLGTCRGVRLTLVLGDPPPRGTLDGGDLQGRLRVLGPLPHEQVLVLQGQADVLLSLGNHGMPSQVPGKLFEYFGVEKPILHIQGGADDAALPILERLGRGWSCPDDASAIAMMLDRLREQKIAGQLFSGLQLSPVPAYAVSALGRRLSGLLTETIKRAAGEPGRAPGDHSDR